MLNITVAGEAPESTNIEFELRSDNGDINIYANDDLIGYFEVTGEDKQKIRFVALQPDNPEFFVVDDEGYITDTIS